MSTNLVQRRELARLISLRVRDLLKAYNDLKALEKISTAPVSSFLTDMKAGDLIGEFEGLEYNYTEVWNAVTKDKNSLTAHMDSFLPAYLNVLVYPEGVL